MLSPVPPTFFFFFFFFFFFTHAQHFIWQATNAIDSIPTHGPLYLPGDGYDCVNKPKYNCPEKVERALAKCSTCVSLKRGTGPELSLHTISPSIRHTSETLNGDLENPPGDVEFDCVNKPEYNCTESVSRAGAKCSVCRRLGRAVGPAVALHSIGYSIRYTSESFNEDLENPPGDVDFDCVNKPEYGCPEKVYTAGAKCSKCRADKLGTGSGFNLHSHHTGHIQYVYGADDSSEAYDEIEGTTTGV